MSEEDETVDDQDLDPLASHPLLAPLTEGQQRFVDTAFLVVTIKGHEDWPVFDFMRRMLLRHGLDAEAELASFPSVSHPSRMGRPYRHVYTENGGMVMTDTNRVQVTIAGLLQESSGAGANLADFLARCVARLAEFESMIEPDPDAPASATFELDDAIREIPGYSTYRYYPQLIGSILAREEPLFGAASPSGPAGSVTWKVTLSRDLSEFLGITSGDDYVRCLLLHLGADLPVAQVAPVDPPLALVDELGYLDAVWRSHFGDSLFGATKFTSSAGLARQCATSEEFDSRMNALYDVMNRMQVALDPSDEAAMDSSARSKSLQRLRQCLRRSGLPTEEFDRVDRSIGVLQDAVRIRAALHSGADGELPARYRSLGLPFPPGPHSAAWDHIRGRCAAAVRSIREAVDTLP